MTIIPILLVAILGAVVFWSSRRRHSQQTPNTSATSPTDQGVTAFETEMVEMGRSYLQDIYSKTPEIEQRLINNQGASVKVTDDESLLALLRSKSCREWMAIVKKKSDGYQVWYWLPNFEAGHNLFSLSFDKSGQRNGSAAHMTSAMILGESTPPDVGPPPLRQTFGDKCQWLAVKSDDPGAVSSLLKLTNVKEVKWNEGVEAAYARDSKVFVTSPIDGWVLALDSSYTGFGENGELHHQELAAWSAKLNTTIANFVSDRRSGTFGWMLAAHGDIARVYFETEGQVVTNIGKKCLIETAAEKAAVADASDGAIGDVDIVFALAAEWSVDPSTFERREDIPGKGLIGDAPE